MLEAYVLRKLNCPELAIKILSALLCRLHLPLCYFTICCYCRLKKTVWIKWEWAHIEVMAPRKLKWSFYCKFNMMRYSANIIIAHWQQNSALVTWAILLRLSLQDRDSPVKLSKVTCEMPEGKIIGQSNNYWHGISWQDQLLFGKLNPGVFWDVPA